MMRRRTFVLDLVSAIKDAIASLSKEEVRTNRKLSYRTKRLLALLADINAVYGK